MAKQIIRSTARLEARLPLDVYAFLKRAAELQGRTLTDFVVTAARDAACRTIEEAEIIRLSVEDQRLLSWLAGESRLHNPLCTLEMPDRGSRGKANTACPGRFPHPHTTAVVPLPSPIQSQKPVRYLLPKQPGRSSMCHPTSRSKVSTITPVAHSFGPLQHKFFEGQSPLGN